MGRHWPSQSLPWGLFTIVSMFALERDCLRKGAVFTCPVKPRHIAGTSAWKSFWKYFYLFHTEQNAPSKRCICSATVTNSASSLCSPIPNCMQGQGCMQTPMEELGSRGRGDWGVNITYMAEAAHEGLHHLN